MFIKLVFLDPKKRLILRKIFIKLSIKSSKFARKNSFLVLIIAILSIYLIRRFDLYIRHLLLRRNTDIIKDFIPHGGTKELSSKNILFWNKNSFGENFDINQDDLNSIDCPVNNCIFTNNRGLIQSVVDFDAIIFHIDNSNDVSQLPEIRNSNQIYVMGSQR